MQLVKWHLTIFLHPPIQLLSNSIFIIRSLKARARVLHNFLHLQLVQTNLAQYTKYSLPIYFSILVFYEIDLAMQLLRTNNWYWSIKIGGVEDKDVSVLVAAAAAGRTLAVMLCEGAVLCAVGRSTHAVKAVLNQLIEQALQMKCQMAAEASFWCLPMIWIVWHWNILSGISASLASLFDHFDYASRIVHLFLIIALCM